MFSLQTIRWADLLRIRIDCYNLASVLKTFVYKEGYIHLYLHVYLYTYNLIIVKVPLDVNVFFLLWKASVGSFKNICKTKANIIPCSLTVHPFVFFLFKKNILVCTNRNDVQKFVFHPEKSTLWRAKQTSINTVHTRVNWKIRRQCGCILNIIHKSHN